MSTYRNYWKSDVDFRTEIHSNELSQRNRTIYSEELVVADLRTDSVGRFPVQKALLRGGCRLFLWYVGLLRDIYPYRVPVTDYD